MLAEFDCGGGNATAASTAAELKDALTSSEVTCVKLAAGEYQLNAITAYDGASWFGISRKVAIVAEGGRVTLDAGGARRHLHMVSGGNLALVNLTLTGGGGQVPPLRIAPSPTRTHITGMHTYI